MPSTVTSATSRVSSSRSCVERRRRVRALRQMRSATGRGAPAQAVVAVEPAELRGIEFLARDWIAVVDFERVIDEVDVRGQRNQAAVGQKPAAIDDEVTRALLIRIHDDAVEGANPRSAHRPDVERLDEGPLQPAA